MCCARRGDEGWHWTEPGTDTRAVCHGVDIGIHPGAKAEEGCVDGRRRRRCACRQDGWRGRKDDPGRFATFTCAIGEVGTGDDFVDKTCSSW